MVRIPEVCNHNSETTVLAHYRLAGVSGIGMKSPDILGAWACSAATMPSTVERIPTSTGTMCACCTSKAWREPSHNSTGRDYCDLHGRHAVHPGVHPQRIPI